MDVLPRIGSASMLGLLIVADRVGAAALIAGNRSATCRPPGASLSLLTVVFCGSFIAGAALGFIGVDGSGRKRIWPCSLARLLPRGCCRCFWIFFPYRILCNPNVARPPRPLQGAGRAGTKPYRAYKAYSVFVETSQAAPLLASRQLIKTSNVTTFRRVM